MSLEKTAKQSVREKGDFFSWFIVYMVDYRGFKGADLQRLIEKLYNYDEEIDEWWDFEGEDFS